MHIETDPPMFVTRAGRLWAAGYATDRIASILNVAEADIYNRLDRIKATARRKPMPGLDLDVLGLTARSAGYDR